MADIYGWLKDLDRNLGASFEQRNGDLFTKVPMDEIIPLDLDEGGNAYFNVPHAWSDHYEPQINGESIPIDLFLYTMMEFPAPTTTERTVVTIPEEFAETSSKILVYLTKVLDIPEIADEMGEESTGEMTFTAEELEALESITEEDSEPPIPNDIDGVRVNTNPRSKEIKEIIDLRHIGSHRRIFYLARTIDGVYY